MIPPALGDAVAQADRAPTDRAAALLRPFLDHIGWFHDLLARGCAAMAADPLHLPDLRASRNGMARHLVIARTSRIWLTATTLDRHGGQPAGRVHFSGRRILCRPLNAPLSGDVFRLEDERAVPDGKCHIAPDDLLDMDERRCALRLHPGDGPLMILRAQIAPEGPVRSRIHDCASGETIALADVDEEQGRALMLLSLLRLQRRTDAAPDFAAALTAPLPAQRWAVMREYLALDTMAALPTLRVMGRDEPDDRVRALARTTLAHIDAAPCPA